MMEEIDTAICDDHRPTCFNSIYKTCSINHR